MRFVLLVLPTEGSKLQVQGSNAAELLVQSSNALKRVQGCPQKAAELQFQVQSSKFKVLEQSGHDFRHLNFAAKSDSSNTYMPHLETPV